MPEAKRKGRPPLTDRAAILRAARQIGFRDLTIGAVTKRLGVKYSTFYRHFPSHDSLVAALVDDVLDEVELPRPAGDWQVHVAATASVLFDVFEQNSGLAEALLALPELPDRLNTAYDQTAGLLLDVGFGVEDAVLAASLMIELAVGPFMAVRADVTGAELRRTQAHAALDRLDPRLRDATSRAVDGPADTWFQAKVDLLIEGLAARLAAGRDQPTG